MPLMELRDLIRTVAQNDGEHDTAKTANGRRIGMRAERQTPTIKVGTTLLHRADLDGGRFTVLEILRDGVLLSTPEGVSLKASFFEVETFFA